MMDMKPAERNRQIKKLLRKAFAPHAVSVTGGRGTAWGWVDVEIAYAPKSSAEWQELHALVPRLIKAAGLKLGRYYGDDDYAKDEIIVQFARRDAA